MTQDQTLPYLYLTLTLPYLYLTQGIPGDPRGPQGIPGDPKEPKTKNWIVSNTEYWLLVTGYRILVNGGFEVVIWYLNSLHDTNGRPPYGNTTTTAAVLPATTTV